MAEALKNLFSPEWISRLAAELKKHDKTFDSKGFVKHVLDESWEARELKGRMRHISETLNRFLPMPFHKQVKLLMKTAPAFGGFVAMVFPDFVEVFGLGDPDHAIPALELFTQYSSSEFAVRPFIVKYEKRMLAQHLAWASHPNEHVRRLASEGIRPRLPWAMALPQFKKDPSPLLPILEKLKNDPGEYVRRSVANNLNDISKDHPSVVLELLEKWKNISPETDKILRHASRSLLKQGHTAALSSFGHDHKARVSVSALTTNRERIRIGENISLRFRIKLLEKKEHSVRVEYKVYYVKSNGSLSPKVFQVGSYKMKAGEEKEISRQHSFAERTTRKHYAGIHRIAIVINGKEQAEKSIRLTGKA